MKATLEIGESGFGLRLLGRTLLGALVLAILLAFPLPPLLVLLDLQWAFSPHDLAPGNWLLDGMTELSGRMVEVAPLLLLDPNFTDGRSAAVQGSRLNRLRIWWRAQAGITVLLSLGLLLLFLACFGLYFGASRDFAQVGVIDAVLVRERFWVPLSAFGISLLLYLSHAALTLPSRRQAPQPTTLRYLQYLSVGYGLCYFQLVIVFRSKALAFW